MIFEKRNFLILFLQKFVYNKKSKETILYINVKRKDTEQHSIHISDKNKKLNQN
jgi:hypothetical protein